MVDILPSCEVPMVALAKKVVLGNFSEVYGFSSDKHPVYLDGRIQVATI